MVHFNPIRVAHFIPLKVVHLFPIQVAHLFRYYQMKQRKNVFWQIIAYEQDVKNIKAAIKNRKNISVVSLFDYQNKTDEDISEILLKNYIMWKSKS